MVREQMLHLSEKINKFFAVMPFEFLQNDPALESIYNKALNTQLKYFMRNLEYEERLAKRHVENAPTKGVKFKRIREVLRSLNKIFL
jgi:hypothetical protein